MLGRLRVTLFQRLSLVEKNPKEIAAEERTAHRRKHAGPVLDELHAWLLGRLSALPGAATGKGGPPRPS